MFSRAFLAFCLITAAAARCRVYLIGGISAESSIEIFDVQSENFASGGKLPTPRNALVAANLNGWVYAIGGFNGTANFATNEVLCSKGFVQDLNMPIANSYMGVAVCPGRKIYTVGGISIVGDNVKMLNTLLSFDGWSWSTLAPMPTVRVGVAAVIDGTTLYAIGGHAFVDAAFTDVWYSTVEAYDTIRSTWSKAPNMQVARLNPCAVATPGKIYVFGGESDQHASALSSVEIYNLATRKWSFGPNLSIARVGCGAVVINQQIYVFGGTSKPNDENPLNTAEVFDTVKGTWRVLPMKMTNARAAFGITLADNNY